MRLADLVSETSWTVLRLLDVDPRKWLQKPVSEWENEEGFVAYTWRRIYMRRAQSSFVSISTKNGISLSYLLGVV